MNYVVETQNLSKRYGKNFAVNKVNMKVPEGSVYGFVGENGSGKTTIMRLLMGLAIPTSGTYALFDTSCKSSKIYKVRNQISAIIEAPSLVPTMTAKENLTYACYYYGVKNLSIIDRVLEAVELTDTGKKKVKNFSLGMRQRLGIAVLLLNNPKLMLLDEPMNGLDPAGIADLRNLIVSLNQKGITFVISSHILSELEKVATYYGFIKKGKLLQEISAEDLARACTPSIEIRHENLELVAATLSNIGIKNYKNYGVYLRIYDEIMPLDLLQKLSNKGIEIKDIRTHQESVEDYYLNLIGGQNND